MIYKYQKKTVENLEAIAALILSKVPHRINGCLVDIEGIVEDFGITLLPRRGGLHNFAFGYTPKDPHYIVVAEAQASYPPQYRCITSEEFCHIVLEYELYETGKNLPEGAAGHELTFEQHKEIENQAIYLAGALIYPKAEFTQRFVHHLRDFSTTGGDKDKIIRTIARQLSEEFEATDLRTGRRLRDLELITPADYERNFPARILF